MEQQRARILDADGNEVPMQQVTAFSWRWPASACGGCDERDKTIAALREILYRRFLEAVRPALEAPLCPTTDGLVCFFCGASAPPGARTFAHIPACAVERWQELDLRTSA